MTPQQANTLISQTLAMARDWADHPDKIAIIDCAIAAIPCRAPAPTEPAVAFMCAALAFAKAHIDSDELERIDDMNPTDESWSAVLVSHEDYNTTKAALLVCYRALATPASPAVPAKPLHQVVAEWDAMPYAKASAVTARPIWMALSVSAFVGYEEYSIYRNEIEGLTRRANASQPTSTPGGKGA